MIQKISDIFEVPDLRKRVIYMLTCLAVYRLGAAIPIPGINGEALRAIFQALAAEGIEVNIYPSRDNADYQVLAETTPNIICHPSLAPERLFEEITQLAETRFAI